MIRYAIPSFQRYKELGTKTLNTLKNHDIPINQIDIFVANQDEYDKYKENYPDYNIIIGVKGMKEIREFYLLNYYKEGDKIVSMDDDIECIKMKNPRGWEPSSFEEGGCPDFKKEVDLAFEECEKSKRRLWGVYPVDNHFFMKNDITYDYKLIIGGLFGIIIKKELCELGIDQYEDYERTIKHYIADGGVVRLNYLCCKTKNIVEGGMGKKREFEKSLKYLEDNYPNLVSKKLKGTKQTGKYYNPILKDTRSQKG
tara:strand:+ start:1490 stop:2254 length:765 start_codon:yes stop_codon:yes gene_type:complete